MVSAMTHAMAMPVRVFERREVREAVAYAQTGGIALHFFRWSHPHFGTGEYCHVLSSDRNLLIAFGWRALALRRLATKLTASENDLNREGTKDAKEGRERA